MPIDTGVEPRTFVNDPFPPPKAPAPSGLPPASAPAAAPDASGAPGADMDAGAAAGAPQMTTPAAGAFAPPKRIFTVVDGKDGRDVFMIDDSLNETKLGRVNVPDANAVLDKAGVYNPATKSWDVPEDVAKSLLAGRLSFPEYLIAKHQAGEAGVVRSMLGLKFLNGEMSREEAQGRGETELLKVQLGDEPATAWSGGFGNFVANLPRLAAGEVAQMEPFVRGTLKEGVKDAAILGGGAMAITALALGTGGLAAPAGVAGVLAMMNAGATNGTFRYTAQMETGSSALDMADEGFEDKQIKALAPLAGTIKGALQTMGFRFLTAPLKRVVLKEVMSSAAVKGFLTKWYINYAKEVGAQVSVMEATEYVNQVTHDLAALQEKKPLMSDADSISKLVDTAVRTAAGVSLLKVPGAALEAGAQHLAAKGEKAGEAKKAPAAEAKPKELPAPEKKAEVPGEKPDTSQMTAPKEAPSLAEKPAAPPAQPSPAAEGAPSEAVRPDFFEMVDKDGPGEILEHGSPEEAALAAVLSDQVEQAVGEDPLAGLLPHEQRKDLVPPGGKPPEPGQKGLAHPEHHLDPIVVSWIDKFMPDPHLAGKNQFYGLMVHAVDAARAAAGGEATAIRHVLMELGLAAEKSRDRGLGDKIAPTMPEVMRFLEAETPETEKAAFAKLTPEEKRLGEFLRAFYDRAYDYLHSVEGMESRWADKGYFPHMQKPVSEILRGLPQNGFVKTMAALMKRWDLQTSDMSVKVGDEWVPRNKFFKHTLYRAGEIDPSENVIKVTDHYLKQLAVKKAIDQAQPVVHGFFRDFASLTDQRDKSVRQANEALFEFMGDYLNNQKGHSVLEKVVPLGSGLDMAFRAARSYISFLSIAGNVPLQAISAVGEGTALGYVAGPKVIALGLKRVLTDEGRSFLKKYEHFTGKSALSEANLAGANLEDKMSAVFYGIITANRTHAAEVALLGSLSENELKTGVISPERQANLKQTLGMGVDLPGNKSIFGSTSVGANLTQFRGWAIPIALTMSQDMKALGRQLANMGDSNMRVTPEQRGRMLRAAAISATAVLGLSLLGNDPKDKTAEGQARRKLLSEMFTLTGALDPKLLLTVGPSLSWVMRMGAALSMLATFEKYKNTNRDKGVHKGDSKGWAAVKETNTMGAWRALHPEKKKKR